uniref:Splicing factor Cactin n=1 Tax=Macrostomum lignano TaxID=282301 RepID=A0A1I8F574_9PLAT
VRERCRQNELEREARLKEQEQEQRDRESENFRQWWQQEDAARARSAIRIAEGRAKPIDLLGRYAEALQRISGIKIKRDDGADDNDDEFDEDESLAFLDAHSPDALLTGLSKLERQSGLTEGACRDSETFWSCVALLVQHALDSKSAPAASSATAAVADRIDAVIRGKSASQLAALEDSVSARICAAGPGTDLAYWEEDAGQTPEPEEKTEEIAVKTPGLAAWSDRLKPKKPRYFNRVNTGYNWGAYNRTHFDSDNPPPKIVQGYKFNIFYPDLLDKSKAPSYSTEPCKDDPQFAILRFTAGPPYEDVAFKIVRNEWDTSFRHGFRCQFISIICALTSGIAR